MGKYSSLIKQRENDSSKRSLRFIKGKYLGGEFFLSENTDITIGRDIGNDIALIDKKVSRKHAFIFSSGGMIFIKDNGSTNGTFLNGERLPEGIDRELHAGDEIAIGDSTILFTDPLSVKSEQIPANHLNEGFSDLPEKQTSVEMRKTSDRNVNFELSGFDETDELDIEMNSLERKDSAPAERKIQDEDISGIDSLELEINELELKEEPHPVDGVSSLDLEMDSLELEEEPQGVDEIPTLDLEMNSLELEEETAGEKEGANSFDLELDLPEAGESTELKVKMGRIELEKVPAPGIRRKLASAGSLSDTSTLTLLKSILSTNKSGTVKFMIDSPFKDIFEIKVSEGRVTSAKCLKHPEFCQPKVLSRVILGRDGRYEFKQSETPSAESNDELHSVYEEICREKVPLRVYTKIVKANQLRFMIPITGKLSKLSASELESIQFMVNTQEVLPYLNMFPENDDFILLSEIKRYIDLGILFGDNNEELEDTIPDDILDI